MRNKSSFREIDGLKGLFIMLIVIMHIQEAFQYSFYTVLRPVYSYGGYFGNYMFFLLSGFLMGYWYTERIRNCGDGDTENKSVGFLAFLKKRLLRIYPLYFVTNVFSIVLELIFHGKAALDIRHIFLSFMMMSTGWVDDTNVPYNRASWFVNVLMVCFILFYLVCRAGRKNKTVFYAFTVIGILAGHAFMISDLHVPFCFRTNGEGYFNFFAGVLLAQWFMAARVKAQTAAANTNKKDEIIAIAAGTGNLLIIAACIVSGGLSNATSDVPTTVSLMVFLLLITVLYGKGLKTIFRNPVFVFLGKISMSIFLWHLPLLDLIQYTGNSTGFNAMDPRIQFLAYLAIMLGISWLSYKFLESRIQNLFRKIINTPAS